MKWLYDWQPEGGDMAHWWLAPAWDQWNPSGKIEVLVVAMPLNFLVRMAFLTRFWVYKHARFGSLEAWYRRPCPHCGRRAR